MSNATDEVDVLICGGGPVGLALAVELGRNNVSCMLVERRTRPSEQSRAKLANVRTMELMRRFGLAEQVRARALLPRGWACDVVFATRLLGDELARFPKAFNTIRQPDDPFPEPSQIVPQYVVEGVLREYAEQLASVSVRAGARLFDLAEDARGLTCALSDERGRSCSVRCRFLVGADGAHSTVREALGIGVSGVEAIARNLGLSLRAPQLRLRHSLGEAVQYWLVNEPAPGIIGPLDGRELWWFQAAGIPPGVDPSELDVDSYLTEAVGGRFEYEVLASDPWVASAVLADRYRDGAVFLAGDAAHLHPPMGGYGMNMGIGDAIDLGWKLAAVVGGWGGEQLLASYEAERRPIHRRVVDEAVSNYGVLSGDFVAPGLERPGLVGARAREAAGRRIREEKAKEFNSIGVQLGYRYEGSPLVVSDGSEEPQNPVGSYTQTARPGHRAPHLWLGDGEALYDRFEGQFALLATDDHCNTERWRQAAEACGMPLRIVFEPSRRLRRLYGAPLALVRPDMHVAWRGEDVADPVTILDIARGAGEPQASDRSAKTADGADRQQSSAKGDR